MTIFVNAMQGFSLVTLSPYVGGKSMFAVVPPQQLCLLNNMNPRQFFRRNYVKMTPKGTRKDIYKLYRKDKLSVLAEFSVSLKSLV